jgi:hypothetical protein
MAFAEHPHANPVVKYETKSSNHHSRNGTVTLRAIVRAGRHHGTGWDLRGLLIVFAGAVRYGLVIEIWL